MYDCIMKRSTCSVVCSSDLYWYIKRRKSSAYCCKFAVFVWTFLLSGKLIYPWDPFVWEYIAHKSQGEWASMVSCVVIHRGCVLAQYGFKYFHENKGYRKFLKDHIWEGHPDYVSRRRFVQCFCLICQTRHHPCMYLLGMIHVHVSKYTYFAMNACT